jgi:phosphatidylserine/phosphatidylglycerophosphate/cardiolipin synthase-like enzyme
VTEPQAPRTTTDRSKTGRMFDRVGRGRPIPGNAVTLLQDSPEALEAMLALIASAQHWVHFDNYIVREDGTGQRFADALAERARAGVRVRVLTAVLVTSINRLTAFSNLVPHGEAPYATHPATSGLETGRTIATAIANAAGKRAPGQSI